MENNHREFLNSTLKEIMSVIQAESGSLFLFDSENRELVLNSFYNSKDLKIQGTRRKIGEGVCGKVADIRKAVLVKDINEDSRFSRNGFKHYRTNSFISIPIINNDKLVGLVNLADKSDGGPFSESDLKAATTLAKYACIVLDNIDKYAFLKQNLEELHSQKNLLEKYASVGKLAAGVVHEVNNPLDGIIRYTNMLLEQIEENTVSREYLLEIKKGLSRIANITRSLLEFSSQVNSFSPERSKYVSLNKIIEESLDIFKSRLDNAVSIKRNYSQPLPLLLDFGLQHVVVNMVKNAIDAIGEKGVLELGVVVNEEALKISFKDTGSGIPPEIQPRIFEPFFTTKKSDSGTGLGLSICKEIINRYAGAAIDVVSSSNHGALFTVKIPAKYIKYES